MTAVRSRGIVASQVVPRATVDIRPLLDRMPRRLIPVEEGLRSSLSPAVADAPLGFDGVRLAAAPEAAP
jgi:hypothetical protein